MSIMASLKEYAKLARSFNMALTGMSPVFGALAMFGFDPFRLFILFILGCGAHIFGFVLNDYIDIKIDASTDELSERPLISGTISERKALGFAIFGLILMLGFGLYLTFPSKNLNSMIPFLILLLAAASSVIYNLVSKKLPGMDVFVAGAIGLLTLYGSATVSMAFSSLALTMALLSFFQVMFMNIVAGGLKDIDHDYKAGGTNLAIAMGCKVETIQGDRIEEKDGTRICTHDPDQELIITASFKSLAHTIELVFLALVIIPFVMNVGTFERFELMSLQFPAVLALGALMVAVSSKLMSMDHFHRSRMRTFIGAHYTINFSLVPVMLSVLSPWIVLFAFVPPFGFMISNKILHGEVAAPKTM